MARVRVIIYRDESDQVLEDFMCEDPDANSYKTALQVVGAIPEDLWLGNTQELMEKESNNT